MLLGLILAFAHDLRNEIHIHRVTVNPTIKCAYNMFDNRSYRLSSLIEVNFCR